VVVLENITANSDFNLDISRLRVATNSFLE